MNNAQLKEANQLITHAVRATSMKVDAAEVKHDGALAYLLGYLEAQFGCDRTTGAAIRGLLDAVHVAKCAEFRDKVARETNVHVALLSEQAH